MIQKGQGRDLDTFTAMGQIPRSTERILVLYIFCITSYITLLTLIFSTGNGSHTPASRHNIQTLYISLSSDTKSQYQRVTDGRTDGRTEMLYGDRAPQHQLAKLSDLEMYQYRYQPQFM